MNENEDRKWPEDVLERLNGYGERVGKQIGEVANEFKAWLKSDNVIELSKDGVSFWASQDAQYRNKLYTRQDAWNYYQKEFINQ